MPHASRPAPARLRLLSLDAQSIGVDVAHDGGSRVTHYMVERRDVRQNQWIVISSFCKNTAFTVQGLTEGQEYLFRILAANVNGTGPPLDGVNPVRAKAPYDVPGGFFNQPRSRF